MTDREKAIVMAYTGVAMLTGEKLQIFYEYIEKILGRPVWTHELAVELVWNEIKEKSKADFLEICKSEERPTGHWYEKRIDEQYGNPPHGFLTRYEWRCSECEDVPCYEHDIHTLNFCPNCGADMRVKPELNTELNELNNERPQREERMFNPYDHRGITEI